MLERHIPLIDWSRFWPDRSCSTSCRPTQQNWAISSCVISATCTSMLILCWWL